MNPWDHDPQHYRTTPKPDLKPVLKYIALHLREDHDMSLNMIQRRLGVSREVLKDMLSE